MKAVVLVIAVLLACAVYEIDREPRIAWHPDIGRALDIAPHEDRLWAWDVAPGAPEAVPYRHQAGSPGMATGQVEFEQSTRLFGPGVSRRQQIRI